MVSKSARRVMNFARYRSVSKTLLGQRVRVPVEIGSLWRLLFDSRYTPTHEPDVIRRMLADLIPTDRVYDVGANVGIDSLLFSLKVAHVVAFEPNPPDWSLLKKTLRENSRDNTTVVGAAIGLHVGPAFLRSEGKSSRLVPTGGVPVEMTTIDAMANQHGRPDAIKIDVEGAELDVLLGAETTLPTCRVVFVEIHLDAMQRDFGSDPSGIWEFMQQHGFRESWRFDAMTGSGSPDSSRVHAAFRHA